MPPSGFRLGIYVFKDAEVLDYTAPYGVFAVAQRFDPDLQVFLLAEAQRPLSTQGGLAVWPDYCLADRPHCDAFLLPGGVGSRQEMHNRRLHEYIRALPTDCLLASVGSGSWVYARMGLLDGLAATNRKEAERSESQRPGMPPLERLGQLAPTCQLSGARLVDAGRVITAGGMTAGIELGLHLLRRAGHDEAFIAEVVRVMEYSQAYAGYRWDIECEAKSVANSVVRAR